MSLAENSQNIELSGSIARTNVEAPDATIIDFADAGVEAELDERFSQGVLGSLALEYLVDAHGANWRDIVGGRQWVVSYIEASSPYADLARGVETKVFADWFGYSKSQVLSDYGKYDAGTTFVSVLDVSTHEPTPASALRIVRNIPGIGLKDVNDLVADSPYNPWLDEIISQHFSKGESYDTAIAWSRLGKAAGVDLSLDKSVDIASHASAPGYNGQHGAINGPSMLFYHSCLRKAIADGDLNLLAIFDERPYENLQQFGDPFDAHDGLSRHPYGGPYDTVPAYCVIERGMKRIRDKDPIVGQVFIDGLSLNDIALMPNEYDSNRYSNKAVGLPPINQ